MISFMFLRVLVVFLVCGHGLARQKCPDSLPEMPRNTTKSELSYPNDSSWKEGICSHYHLNPTDESAWSNLLPEELLKEFDPYSWAMLYRKMKNPGGFNVSGSFLKEMSLHDVRVNPGSLHGQAQQTNLEYLLMMDVDSLVYSFRNTSGLAIVGKPYGGWEDPATELRGHFVGHYMSASAQMWASTHNESLKEKMSAVVSALSECQNKTGTGYLSAFPTELFDRIENGYYAWAPYYTIHKILAGLVDQYQLAGNSRALKMATWMVDYFYNRVLRVISLYTIDRHWETINEETGGMNDVLYRIYSITHDEKHLVLAHLFDKSCFLGPLALKVDELSGFHVNTHIPLVVGTQMRYEVTGDSTYKDLSTFFLDIVNSSHSYATGGTSVSEFWREPLRLADYLTTETEESCTTYNLLKVSRHLFRWTKGMAYADHYERALTNGVLSIQRGTEPGLMIYMLPLGRGNSKARNSHGWGTPFESFWCCYGTGIESFSKLGDSIYFEEQGEVPGLYIIQYISSSLDWKTGQIVLNQQVDPVVSWDNHLRLTYTISSSNQTGVGASLSTLNLRIPFWTDSAGAKAALNGLNLTLPPPGSFLSFTNRWCSGDNLTLELPISLRTDAIKDDRSQYESLQAIFYGPYLLAGLSSGDWNISRTQPATSLSDWITPIPATSNSQLISLSQASGNSTFVLTNTNQSLTMENYPEAGTDASVHATFRLVLADTSSFPNFSGPKDAIGKSVMLEPFDFPGMVVVPQAANGTLEIAVWNSTGSAVFNLVAGLDGEAGTVSLESRTHKGCFVYNRANSSVKMSCNSAYDAGFKQATSFLLNAGLSKYHPISFVAEGASRNFVLAPLLSLRDESYTVYFNI